MFNVKEVIREVEAEKKPESEDTPRANRANRANFRGVFSTFSTISTPPPLENENPGKLEALKLIYGEPGQEEEENPIPFTDHEIAEHKIDTEVHRDDRSFVRQQLLGVYGVERLSRVDEYLRQLRLGAESVSEPYKKSNAGRKRANIWIRRKLDNEASDDR